MKAVGYKLDVRPYASLITAYGKGSQWKRARKVFKAMEAAGVQADVLTYNALVTAYGDAGELTRQERRSMR